MCLPETRKTPIAEQFDLLLFVDPREITLFVEFRGILIREFKEGLIKFGQLLGVLGRI